MRRVPTARVAPALDRPACHDWARKFFRHLPAVPGWAEHLDAGYVHVGTSLEYAARSREGLMGAVLVARHPKPRRGGRRMLMWHGRHRLVEEAFHGWFGRRVERIRSDACRLLLERLDHFVVVNPSTVPTFVLPLPGFAALGVSHGVLEQVVGAPVVVAAESLYARAAYAPSLRFYLDYDGARYGESTRKLFQNAHGAAVPVEWLARDLLRQFGYDVVSPTVFTRLFHALVGRPSAHFSHETWPGAFLGGRLSPLEWVERGRQRLDHARDAGVRAVLEAALEAVGRRRPYRDYPPPAGGLPLLARYLNRPRFASLLESLGDRAIVALLEGLLLGYRAAAADWFAWRADAGRAHFCEVKSRGDVLRPTQKEAILWSQRTGALDYRLLEVLHGRVPVVPAEPF